MRFIVTPLVVSLGLVSARPQTSSRDVYSPLATAKNGSLAFVYNGTEHIPRAYTLDEVHDNVLSSWPNDLTIHSGQLSEYLKNNTAEPVLVYLHDKRQWISTRNKPNNTSSLVARDRDCIDEAYQTYKTLGSQSYWGPWAPVSNCYYNNNDETNTETLSYTDTWGYSFNPGGGLNAWGEIRGILSASFGFSFSESWSESHTYSCGAPPYSEAQLWAQHLYGWNAVKVDEVYCNIKQSSWTTWINAPVDGSSTFGCSTGAYVDCNHW